MIYVLDQNYLRSDELKALVSVEPHAKFVIPDIALLEMCKGDKWRETMQRSLSILADCPARVFSSMSVGDALRFELEKSRSIEGHLLPHRFRKFLRSILAEIKTGGAATGINTIETNISEYQKELRKIELNHERNQLSLNTRTTLIMEALAGEPLKQLKKGLGNENERLTLIKNISTDLLTTSLKEKNISENKIRSFIRQKPLTLRYYYLNVRHAVEWARMGGLDSFPSEKVTNDILDQDYVVIASFFNKILSKESKVLQTDADLRAILK